jgi:RNA polymerase sigma factor (TIGR02999 family)
MNDVTHILSAFERGDSKAAHELMPQVYDDLCRLAVQRLAQEKPGQTLQPTAPVHEAYLRLIGSGAPARWDGCDQFFAAPAEAMRRILIDWARARESRKRGADEHRVTLDGVATPDADDRLLALDEALTRLAGVDPLAARVVDIRFAGMSHEQVAAALDMSVYLARQKWTSARAWLKTALGAS